MFPFSAPPPSPFSYLKQILKESVNTYNLKKDNLHIAAVKESNNVKVWKSRTILDIRTVAIRKFKNFPKNTELQNCV